MQAGKILILFLIFLSLPINMAFSQDSGSSDTTDGGFLKIVVLNFDSGGYSISSDTVTRKIKSALPETGRFNVISGRKVESVLSEMGLDNSGILPPGSAVELGRKLKADLVLMGEVNDMTINRSSFDPGVDMGKIRIGRTYTVKARFEILIRLVHVTGRSVLFSELFSGTAEKVTPSIGYGYSYIDLDSGGDDNVAGKAFRRALEQFTKKMKESIPSIGVVLSVEEENIIIDMGRNRDIQPGTRFLVYNYRNYTHPGTGENIQVKEKAGAIQVVEVLDNISHCRILEGNLDSIKAGSMVSVQNSEGNR